MSRIFISAAHKSSGKTTVSIGLCAALSQQGYSVQPFKKGPDYIDPMWLTSAAGSSCHNLDFYTMSREEILQKFHDRQAGEQINLIEGNKGLYDGLDLDGSNSNAALAKLLQSPVILVIDARGMTRGIAPLILGYQAFDTEVNIAGVILNQLGGQRHENKLRRVIEHYTDVPVLGAVYRNMALEIDERHLGLMPSNEARMAQQQIQTLADSIRDQVDLNAVVELARQAPDLDRDKNSPASTMTRPDVKIGIARDAAFGFYYPDDLDAFRDYGAQLVEVDLINDSDLPELDGLFIGGGFPETQMEQLEKNSSMRQSVRLAIENGLPCYAECGGLMYLAQTLQWQDKKCQMAGVLPGNIVMHPKPQGRGYIQIQETGLGLWPVSPYKDQDISAHEFHYSSFEHEDHELSYAYKVKRGTGIDGQHDGIIYKNLMACYAHLRDTQQSPWVRNFVEFVRNIRKKKVL